MTTKFREFSFIMTITSLWTLAIVAFVATFILTYYSSSEMSLTPLMALDGLLLLTIFGTFVYNCQQHRDTEDVISDEQVDIPSVNPLSYHEIRKQYKKNEEALNEKRLAAVTDYVRKIMCPYLKDSQLTQLIDNVILWVDNDDAVLTPIATDSRLTTLDLRHLAWNIGERFNWSGVKRASFIKIVFPVEMKELEVQTIRRNLRQTGNCLIELDIPPKGNYDFFVAKDR